MKCPFCGHQRFYLKDAANDYETYGFSCETGEVCFDVDVDITEIKMPLDESPVYCETCAWSGKFRDIR